jgi:hypothetical protein
MLVGKAYYSQTRPLSGIIQYAEKRSDVFTSYNEYAYAVKVRPYWNGQGLPKPDFFATIYVGVDE